MSKAWDHVIEHDAALREIAVAREEAKADAMDREERSAWADEQEEALTGRITEVSAKIVVTVLMGCGGPTDGYTLTGTKEWGMTGAESFWHYGTYSSTFPVSEETEPYLWAWLADYFDMASAS